jgi:hypothetical protein
MLMEFALKNIHKLKNRQSIFSSSTYIEYLPVGGLLKNRVKEPQKVGYMQQIADLLPTSIDRNLLGFLDGLRGEVRKPTLILHPKLPLSAN